MAGLCYVKLFHRVNTICVGNGVEHFHITVFRVVNPLNAELNPVCPLPALLGAHHILQEVFGRILQIAKSDYQLRDVCMSLRPHETTRLPLDGFL